MDKTGRTLVERNEVMEEMINHFQELAKENTIVFEEKDSIKFDEGDEEIKDPTHVRVRKITDKLKKKHKTPEIYGITTELIQKVGPALWNRIYKLIKQMWEGKKVPTGWRTGLKFPIYKKGSKDKRENYRVTTLVPQMYKILSSVLYNRVVRYAELTVGDYRNGFRSGPGITDNIFILRQIIEDGYEHNINLCVLFVDFKHAFNSIKRTNIRVPLRK